MNRDSIFPVEHIPMFNDNDTINPRARDGSPGLTKRELFSAMAMQSLTQGMAIPLGSMVTWNPHEIGRRAQGAVIIADALLAELERRGE